MITKEAMSAPSRYDRVIQRRLPARELSISRSGRRNLKKKKKMKRSRQGTLLSGMIRGLSTMFFPA